MQMVKWNPQRAMMSRDLDRVWSDLLGGGNRAACDCEEGECAWSPKADISEVADRYNLVIEIPGVEKSDISLKVEDGVLTITGERKAADDEGRKFQRVERLFGQFQRRFRLPKEAEADAISAEYKNGLLTISIPKSEKVMGREISIG
jgi:HSP20 family protein